MNLNTKRWSRMTSALLSTALLVALPIKTAALSHQEVQTLVDEVQTQAYQTHTQGAPTAIIKAISQLAYDTPRNELLNTEEIKSLMSAPEMLLGLKFGGAQLAAAKELKRIAAAYQQGQPVKAQVLAISQSGPDMYAQIRYFPDVLQQVEVIDQTKIARLAARSEVIYAFDVKTKKLTKMISRVYQQALDLRNPQLASR